MMQKKNEVLNFDQHLYTVDELKELIEKLEEEDIKTVIIDGTMELIK